MNDNNSFELSGNTKDGSWTILPAKYAKGKFVIRITPFVYTGFKCKLSYLSESVGGKWVHRSHGYTVSNVQAILFKNLADNNWDSRLMFSNTSIPLFKHPTEKNDKGLPKEYSLKEVKNIFKKKK